MISDFPFVSIVMSMFNEEKYISKCLSSLLLLDYPKDKFEVIIVDSCSVDNSVKIVESYSDLFSNLQLISLNKVVPITIALNEGIVNSNGDIIARLDCHVEAPPDFLSLSVTALLNHQAELVSGVICPVGENKKACSIAASLSSDFGIGDAKLYKLTSPVYSNRGYLGVFFKKFVLDLGLYDEKLNGADDFDLFYRIKQINKRILILPGIKMKYYCRDSFKTLYSQYYKYGLTKIIAFKKYRKILSLKSVIPAVFFCLVFILSILSIFCKVFFILSSFLIASYIIASFGFALFNSFKIKRSNIIYNVFAFWVLHFSHSLGFLNGVFCRKYN